MKAVPTPKRLAFTLLEMSAMIAVVGVLSALLLPAVQAAREAARRTQCINNLRQLGLGIQEHVRSKGYYPTAGANGDAFTHFNDPAATNVIEWFGWPFQLLPYVQETALYEAAKSHFEQGGNHETRLPGIDKPLVSVPITLFWCPSRAPRISLAARDGSAYALIDYVGLSQGQLGNQYSLSFNYNFVTGALLKARGWRGIIAKGGHFDGAAWKRWGKVRPSDVSDGTSNTIAVIEKSVYYRQYQPVGNPNQNWAEIPGWAHGAHQTTMRMVTRDASLAELGVYPGPMGPMGDTDVIGDTHLNGYRDRPLTIATDQSPGSAHAVMHTLFGDGSVRGLGLQIDNKDGADGGGVLFKLSVRDDGSSFEANDFESSFGRVD